MRKTLDEKDTYPPLYSGYDLHKVFFIFCPLSCATFREAIRLLEQKFDSFIDCKAKKEDHFRGERGEAKWIAKNFEMIAYIGKGLTFK